MDRLIQEYIAMSQKGTVPFYEETDFLVIAKSFQKTNQLDKAFEVLSHGLVYYPSSAELHTAKALLYAEANEEELSLKHIEKALVFSPSDTEVLSTKVQLLTLFERFDEAQTVIDMLEAQTEQHHCKDDLYMLKANLYEMMEEVDMAYNALADAIRTNPQNEDALSRIWLAADYSQRHEDSVVLHEAVLEEHPYSYWAWNNLGQAHLALKDNAKAAEAFEFSFITNPQFDMAYRACAATCIASGWFRKALSCLGELCNRFGEDHEALTQIGLCHELMSDYSCAQTFYMKALRMNPNCDVANFRMGECMNKGGKSLEAIQFYHRAMELNCLKEEYVAALAQAYYDIEDFENADKYLAEAIEVAPETPKYWISYIDFLIELGSYDCAHRVIEDAELNVYDTYVLYCRVACLYAEGMRKEAINVLIQALDEDSGLGHSVLLELAPDACKDKDVMNLLSAYK